MNIQPKLAPELCSIGYYTSPQGGPSSPRLIDAQTLYFELITEGAVYDFETTPELHGVGTVFLHRPGEWTVSKTQGTGLYRCLTVRYTWEGTLSFDWPRCFLWEDAKAALQFSDEMLFAYHNQVLDRTVLGDYVWHQLRFRLEQSKRHSLEDRIPRRIKAAMTYLDEHFEKTICVDQVAAHVGLSASHLHAHFREHLDQTPHQYLIRTRMRAAAHLLVSSDRPIKQIALNVGYVNTESFCRAFKHHHNRTAATHRRMYQNFDSVTNVLSL